jgi:DNA-binding NarL/FixJ family response regulator
LQFLDYYGCIYYNYNASYIKEHSNQISCSVLGEVEYCVKAIELAATLNPDIILMDFLMLDLNAIQVTATFQELNLRTKIFEFCAFFEEDHTIEMVNAGVQGYV